MERQEVGCFIFVECFLDSRYVACDIRDIDFAGKVAGGGASRGGVL
jgi:hypothetical protein